jgi:hypothetical protein
MLIKAMYIEAPAIILVTLRNWDSKHASKLVLLRDLRAPARINGTIASNQHRMINRNWNLDSRVSKVHKFPKIETMIMSSSGGINILSNKMLGRSSSKDDRARNFPVYYI